MILVDLKVCTEIQVLNLRSNGSHDPVDSRGRHKNREKKKLYLDVLHTVKINPFKK